MDKSMEPTGQIILYQANDGSVSIDVKLDHDTVWLTLMQMTELFGIDKSGISRHIRNIYQSKELTPEATVAKFATVQTEGGREVSRQIEHYNLDMIISVGYRVNSKEGTRFRIWATQVLRDHLVQGFTLNRGQFHDRLEEFEHAVCLITDTIRGRLLTDTEATGLVDVVTRYARTWLLLQKYDEQQLPVPQEKQQPGYTLTYEDALAAITTLKTELQHNGQATDLFGAERGETLEGLLGNLYQTFGGEELYPSVADKAAHLLYFIIKDHPFADGNKRIASLLFILFLARNHSLTAANGEIKFNDNALVALALLVAESAPRQKDTMIRLIMNFVANVPTE